MISTPFSKSKAFKEREQNARERLRQIAKQDLAADLSRLFGDAMFSDVLFMVKNVEFQAHSVVLRARAPKFCGRFLPNHASPVSVQTCIQINGLEAAEFETFLRSAYTDDDFKDYDESSHPWRRQTTADNISVNGQRENSTVSQNDMNGTCSHCGCTCTIINDSVNPSLDSSVHNVDEQGDVKSVNCTQSDCDVETSSCNKHETVSDGVMEDDERADPPQRNADEFVTNRVSQCVDSTCTSELNIQPVDQEPSCFASLNNTEEKVASVEASLSQGDHSSRDQCNTDLVDGLNNMTVEDQSHTESVCQQIQTINNQDVNDTCVSLCTSQAEEEKVMDAKTCELITTHCEVTENDFQSSQGCLDVTVNHTAQNEKSESNNLHIECCSCNIGQALLQLLISGAASDVTFLVNGGKVKAHKAILCARSNYFSAMLHGNWVEGNTNEIPLIGVTYNGLMTVLKYLYGGTVMETDLAVICDTLPLVDMYGLEGLKELLTCTLKIEKCHLFHKPCGECTTGVSECLEVSELFGLTELKKSCIKWMAKNFDRVLGTKGFTTLPKQLQEELLVEIQGNFAISSAIEVLNHCDRLSSCTPLVKWTEPVHVAVSTIQESCLLFISNNFFCLLDEKSFHEILKGIGWSIPVLEKIMSAVKKHLAIENCCDQLRAVLRLKRLLKLRAVEEDKESYPEEVDELIVGLHDDCVKFIRSNLFKVTRSEGWKRLKPATHREIKEGAVFSGLGDARDQRGAGKSTDKRILAPQPSSRSSTVKSSQRVGTASRDRGLGRGSTVTNRVNQGRTGGLVSINKRPSSGRPAAASASKGTSENRSSLSQTSVALKSSRLSSSFSQNPVPDKRPSSARSSTASGRDKKLSSKTSLNGLPPTRSSHQRETLSLKTSNTKKSFSLAREAPNGRPSSAASFSGSKKSQPVSKPPVATTNSKSSSSKSCSREKGLSVVGARVQTKRAPGKSKVQSFRNFGECRKQVTRESVADLDSCNSNETSALTDSSSRSELFQDSTAGLCSATHASKETKQGSVSEVSDESHSNENNAIKEQAIDGESGNENTSLSQWITSIQATSACAEETSAVLVSAESTEDNSLSLNDAAGGHCSDSRCLDTPSTIQFNDSLELD